MVPGWVRAHLREGVPLRCMGFPHSHRSARPSRMRERRSDRLGSKRLAPDGPQQGRLAHPELVGDVLGTQSFALSILIVTEDALMGINTRSYVVGFVFRANISHEQVTRVEPLTLDSV